MNLRIPHNLFSSAARTGRMAPVVLSLATLATSAATAEAALIRIREQADTSSSVVRLGDVADIHDANPEVVRRLSAVTLIPAPPAGRSLPIDFELIRERLVAQGFALNEHEFSGASRILVGAPRPQTQAATGNTLAPLPPNELAHRRAEDYVARAVAEYVETRSRELGKVAVNLTLSVEQATLVNSAGTTRLEISGGTAPWTDEQSLKITLVDRKGQRHVLDVVCSSRQLPRVLAPKANLSRGHILRQEDIVWKQLDSTEDAADYATSLEQVVGQEIRRAFRAGESITVADLRGVPLVKRGEIVTVVARNRGIIVRMDAKSRGDGSLGQQIKVVSLDGRRELTVRITGFHEAAVVAGNEAITPQDSGTGVRLVTSDK